VAVETVGNWYWVVDEIAAGGGKPQLVNARLAKLMMGSVNKSDKLDTKGMNRRKGRAPCRRFGSHPLRFVTPASCRARTWCSAGTPQDDIATESLDGRIGELVAFLIVAR
jgi:hypothetical protein